MAYLLEGHLMLAEGVPAAMIENVARMAGMPVGPLSLTDEIGVDLAWKILQATKKDGGTEIMIAPAQEQLLEEMVVKRERFGRKNSQGLLRLCRTRQGALAGARRASSRRRAATISPSTELKQRLLVTQALEAARTVEEGVVTDPREADVGSILGFGFAPYTGGTLSYIDGMGAKAFVALAERLAEKHGAALPAERAAEGHGERRARRSTAASRRPKRRSVAASTFSVVRDTRFSRLNFPGFPIREKDYIPSRPGEDRMAEWNHESVWGAIDALAARHRLESSGLAKKAGLDPTAFNPSKRHGPSRQAAALAVDGVDREGARGDGRDAREFRRAGARQGAEPVARASSRRHDSAGLSAGAAPRLRAGRRRRLLRRRRLSRRPGLGRDRTSRASPTNPPMR